MLEKILPIAKYIFFHFDYFLIAFLLIVWFFVKLKPNLFISQKIVKLGNIIYQWFIKLIKIKPFKLILIFFIINFTIRLLMAIPVPDISLSKIAPHYLNLAKSMYNGEGFTTHVIWLNFLQHSEVVRPDFFRVPFYPFLIFLSYKIFSSTSYFYAQLVNVIAGSLLPIIAYLFARCLTKSKRIATLLLIFISFNGLIISWTAISYPEIIYCALSILLLYSLYKTKDKINFQSIIVGVLWGLTYLTRTEALYIFLPVILFFYWQRSASETRSRRLLVSEPRSQKWYNTISFYRQNKKQFFIKIALTIFGFLIIASPYLARNYVLTGKPFYSDFDRIVLVAFTGNGHLVESPESEYKNIYDLASKKPLETTTHMIQKIVRAIVVIPPLLISSYVITLLSLIGIFYAYKIDRQKYYLIFLAILMGFAIPTAVVGFEDRYYIFLIVLFYFFASIGIFKLYDKNLKNNSSLKSILFIYLFVFIIFNGLLGIGKGTLPYIPHSFYDRFNADQYFTELREFYDYVKNNTPEGEIVMASRRPYEVYYFTERPTIIFPFTDAQGIQRFMKKYQVKWVIWMGTPQKIEDKYYRFWLPEEIPENIKPVFKNTGGDLFKVEYYIE